MDCPWAPRPGCRDIVAARTHDAWDEAERWGEWKGCFPEDIFCRIKPLFTFDGML